MLNEKEYNGQPPNMNFVPTALLIKYFLKGEFWRSRGRGGAPILGLMEGAIQCQFVVIGKIYGVP